MKNIYLTVIVIMLTAFAIIFSSGCDKRTIDKDNYIIDVLEAPDVIYAESPTEVRALVRDRRTMIAASDQRVTFKSQRGTIETHAITNSMGVAVVNFQHAYTDTTDTVIEAAIDKSVKTAAVTLVPNIDFYQIEFLNLPETIYSEVETEIKVLIRDNEGIAVVDKPVIFNSTYGIIQTNITTNQSGIATTEFIHSEQVSRDNYFKVRVDKSSKTSEMVSLLPNPGVYDIIDLYATPETIYIDNNLTFSTIRAVVRDDQGYAAVGETVRFKTDIGSIIALATTDSTGIARTTFWEGNLSLPGGIDHLYANIEATIDKSVETVQVRIEEAPEITSVSVQAPNMTNLDRDITIQAVARVSEDPVIYPQDGTIITFSTNKGNFDGLTSVSMPTTDGVASVTLYTGTSSGMATINASVGNVSDSHDMYIRNDPPAFVTLVPQVEIDGQYVPLAGESILVNDTRNVRVMAAISDEYGNPVEQDQAVYFETSLGEIDAISSTGSDGVAYADFNPGIAAGLAEINGRVFVAGEDEPISGTTTIRIASDTVHSIRFAHAEELISLDVVGTGGIENAPIRVELRDVNGNLVSGTGFHRVWFEVLSTEIDATVSPSQLWANNGIAVATVNSGSISGPVTVRATHKPRLLDDEGNPMYDDDGNPLFNDAAAISATRSNIVVRSSFPDNVAPFIGEYDTGVNMGHGIWLAQAGAVIKDQFNNPVIDQTAVFFQLSDPFGGSLDASINIVGDGYTGNEDINGETRPGYAYTTITYHGEFSLKYVTLTATTETIDANGNIQTLSGSNYVVLPINQPTLDVVAQPNYAEYFESNLATNSIDVIVSVAMKDGQGNDITGSPPIVEGGQIIKPKTGVIRMTSSRGNFVDIAGDYDYWNDNDWSGYQFINNTSYPAVVGPYNIQTINGFMSIPFRTYRYIAPLPEDEYSTTFEILLYANYLGTNTQQQTTVTVIRYRADVTPSGDPDADNFIEKFDIQLSE